MKTEVQRLLIHKGHTIFWRNSLNHKNKQDMTEDFSLKALVLGTIIMSASAEAESS